MTTTTTSGLTASLSTASIALLLQQPVLAADTPPAAALAPPAGQVTPAPGAAGRPQAEASASTSQHPAQAALAAIEKQRAEHMAELDRRYEALRAEAGSQGFDMPPAPPWAEGPAWLSYDEMKDLMKAQGIDLPDAPSPGTEPTPAPPLGLRRAEEQQRIFDIFQDLTPEQQEACFAIARWQRPPMMQHRIPQAYFQPPMPQYPPTHGPQQGQPYPGMMRR